MKGAGFSRAAAAALVGLGLLAAPLGAEAQVLLHVQGTFTPGLPVDQTGHGYVDFNMVVPRPGLVTIELTSASTSTYDPFLRLFLGATQIAYDDDGAGGLNSRILQFLQPGVYTVRVSKFGSAQVAVPTPFTLTATIGGGGGPGPVPMSEALAQSLASQFYHSYGEWAGQYAMHPIRVRLVPTGPTSYEAHVQYQYSCVRRSCRGAPAGHDQRVFHLQWNGAAWQCARMGGHMSARF